MIRQANDPGFGEKFFRETKRVINKDGSFNVVRIDGGINGRDLYQFLINLSWPKFLLLVFITFIAINSLFALFYLFIGINHLQSAGSGSGFQSFLNAFFFSVQTFTTVGYGGILPEGILANIFAAFEAMTGLLGFAIATGLLYGRFSKPSAKIIFSKNAIIAPHKGKPSLQFRIANQRHNILMELEARIMVVFIDKSKDQFARKYYDLNLEMPSVYFLPLSWTIVHLIDADSPLYGKTPEDLKNLEAEFIILIRGFDDTFSQHVHSRFSYRYDEIIWGAKYKRAFHANEHGELILELEKLDDYEKTDIPVIEKEK